MMSEQEAVDFASDLDDGEQEDRLWACAVDETETVIAAAYCAGELFSDRVWNLYFIAVHPDVQARGVGAQLLAWIEVRLTAQGIGANALIIETSSLDEFAVARAFYIKHAYQQVGEVPDYYGPGDDKIVFWRALRTPSA
jgi:ribosomal protein S18 acetylase RimI-like enzyme